MSYIPYNKVKDFTDLLQTNLSFFKGDISETFYYDAKWGEGEDQKDHAIVSTNNLIELTEKHRIFTVNGQSSYNDVKTDQRSYLCFYMENETFEKIKNKLMEDNRIWTIFIIKKEEISFKYLKEIFFDYYETNYYEISSIKDKNKTRIVLTMDYKEPYSVWRRDLSCRLENETSIFENINSILKNIIYCIIIRKEFNKGPNTDEILLNHLSNI
jgi:hypothetical protein